MKKFILYAIAGNHEDFHRLAKCKWRRGNLLKSAAE